MKSKIKDIKARQIIDSRGTPTIETEIILESGHTGRASVPSDLHINTSISLWLNTFNPIICGFI